MIYLKNYINGELLEPQSKTYIDGYNPSTGKVYSQIPNSDSADVELAIQAAQQAFPLWSNTPKEQRSKVLIKLASLIERDLPRLALAESMDNGKPLKLASTVDIPRAAANFNFYATGILHYASHSHSMEEGLINYTLRQPIGVVGCISPWNLPLYLFTWKIAPALASGNCVVAKPSEITPMTAYLLSELAIEAGLPAGVLNIVHGLGHTVGDAIVGHDDVHAISFTGGTTTGKHIAAKAAPMFKKLSLELGGKNPNIIFDDCDMAQAVKTSVHSSFANQGQICLCGSRIYVQKNSYEKFKELFVAEVKKLKVGIPTEAVNLGAVVSEAHMHKVLSYIELAKEEGGTILTGGNRVLLEGEYAGGYYLQPTVIEGLTHTCRVNQEEVFGPVVTIEPFDDEADAVRKANST
ncbi:MAG: aldehyde dehydrogenase, partial [Bacteroidia bacterium]|nr:aldehyde dehydrogenase [Bacteroidia bacterium]